MVSDSMVPILSNILGLLTAAAPLQSLRFVASAVPPRLLPILQSLPSLTRCTAHHVRRRVSSVFRCM